MLNIVFTNNRAILPTPYAEFTESMLDIILYPESTMGPTWLGLNKVFKIKALRKAKKRHFQSGFC